MMRMMLNVTGSFYEDVWRQDSFQKIVQCFDKELVLSEEAPEKLMHFLELVYKGHYEGQTFSEVLGYTKRDKFSRRKRNWVQKAKKGLEEYIASGKKGKGFNNHLVTSYLKYKEAEVEASSEMFLKEYGASTADEKIQQTKELLKEWGANSSLMLCQYPFFGKLTRQQKSDAIEIDMAMLMGDWLIHSYSQVSVKSSRGFAFEEETSPEFLRQAPTSTVEDGWFGISKKARYPVHPSEEDERVVKVSKKTHFEMEDKKELVIDANSLLLTNSKIKLKELIKKQNSDSDTDIKSNGDGGIIKTVQTPDSKDSRIFLDIINRRGADFKTTRSIKVYLRDLLESNYTGDSSWEYDDCVTRLLKLANFQMTEYKKNGDIHYRRLISKMDIIQDKDQGNPAYAKIYVSDDIHTSILQEECINVYNEKIQELESDLGYHLVFLLQKQRIQNYDKNSKDEYIYFELYFDEFGLRMNKKTKKSNFDDIEEALKEIKRKKFILADFERFGVERFFVKCFPLSPRELEDSVKLKLNIPELVNNN